MISTLELQDSIDKLTVSKDAVTAFARRLGIAFNRALTNTGVEFHAVNDGFFALGQDPNDKVMNLVLRSEDRGAWSWLVRLSLDCEAPDYIAECRSITTMTDSTLAEIAKDWAEKLATTSKNISFKNLYIPKAVEVAEGYNDLQLAFRIVRAWDVVRNSYILRIDCAYTDLTA